MDCYFRYVTHYFKQNLKKYLNDIELFERQSWIDKRLAFKDSTNNITTLALSISMLKKIWKPDTFFFNGKQVIMSIQNLNGHLYEKGKNINSLTY